ncbi:DUF1765-domain-containing protein, partial [Aureobasidium melanogenum]
MTTVANTYQNHADALANPRARRSYIEASNTANFTRSASYTFLGHAATKNPAYNAPMSITNRGSFCEQDLIAPMVDDSTDTSPPESSGWSTPADDQMMTVSLPQDLVAELHKSPKITVTADTEHDPSPPVSLKDGTASIDSAKVLPAPVLGDRTRSPSKSRSLAKRLSRRLSSAPPSRSPSPANRTRETKSDEPAQKSVGDSAPAPAAPAAPVASATLAAPAAANRPVVNRRKSIFRRRDSEKNKEDDTEAAETGGFLARRGTVLKRKSLKPAAPTVTVRASMEEPTKSNPPMPQLPKSFSTDRLHNTTHLHPGSANPMPPLSSAEKYQTLPALSLPRKKDELWSVFRSLDGDYTKFQSKSSTLKANVVRSSLLPFLRNYADHPSNLTLRAEDLDRRTNILNKWWTGLLDMLHGRNNQSISGTDRPAILDGISGIMDRQEWRLSPSPLCPLDRRTTVVPTRNKSTTSLSSTGIDFLTESVHHNVRNMFVQNLNSQMAFVVDRMSLKNASASLVTFCGKATAYAFFFCPGIAEVLVRLWDAPTEVMRRVLSESGVSRFDNLAETAARINSAFPPSMQSLGFVSLGKMVKHLRTQTPLPLGTANIQWYGYWLERWSGRESDLFFAFVKHFHILVADYLPSDATKKERICVPGLLFVHSQILVNLDSTIHRDAGQLHGDPSNNISPTFDDVLVDPDAVASTLPLPPTNAIRIMAENRLIMLIRDFLSERASEHPFARQLFAESFASLLQAGARGISVYNHLACYTLCDFLEEAFAIIVRYEQMHPSQSCLVDTDFWIDVCKRMVFSQNTMTEIRLFAFLYTIWSTVNSSPDRKTKICIDLLLDQEVFDKTFNHWCPMVRAYYMRLLCWRVGRYDGEESSGDKLIFQTLLQRLQVVYSHFLWQRQQAAQGKMLPPSTTPCNPAPSRRLLIIRTDTQVAPGGSFLAFDGIVPPHPSAPIGAPSQTWKRDSVISQAASLDIRPTSSASSSDFGMEPERPESGLRGFLRNIMGGKSRSKATSASAVKTLTPSASLPSVPETTASGGKLSRSATTATQAPRARASAMKQSPLTTPHASRGPSPIRHRNFCFKFSLEMHPKAHHPTAMRLAPPRLPLAAHLYLQQENGEESAIQAAEAIGEAKAQSIYSGRALAEWVCILMECQGFFERRKGEGVPSNKHVETPTLGVEVFGKGSPISALAMAELLEMRALDKLDPDGLGHHQKLIIGEATPANAYYLQAALRACLVDARILHTSLSNTAKARLVDKFNDAKDALKCLIMMYDVGAVGLNLHHSCNRVLIASIARSFALEEQPCGKNKKLGSMSQDLKMDPLSKGSIIS